jgi:hypothetical protein
MFPGEHFHDSSWLTEDLALVMIQKAARMGCSRLNAGGKKWEFGITIKMDAQQRVS